MSIVTPKTVKASNVLPHVKLMNQSAPREDEVWSCQWSDGDRDGDGDGEVYDISDELVYGNDRNWLF